MKTLINVFIGIAKACFVLLVLCVAMFYSGGMFKVAGFYYSHFSKDETVESQQDLPLLDADTVKIRQADLLKRALDNMVSINGGSFTMGADDCHKYPMLSMCAPSPVYPVQLSDYSLSKYKITNQDFDLFLAVHQRLVNPFPAEQRFEHREWNKRHSLQAAQLPARMSWQDAEAYCQWVGQQVNKPMHLPTEAQWEYAARNRGQYVGFATDDGTIKPGQNAPEFDDMNHNMFEFGSYLVDVGSVTPNPLGIYDLIGNGQEWVYDWYSNKERENSLAVDPTGPSEPSYTSRGPAKVIRPYKFYADSSGMGVTAHDRDFAGIQPDNLPDGDGQITARCAIWSH
ncbi:MULTISPECIES: SUMF1/EgtB/PvdO family nonheme iron enzyme [unclassified Brenneria]|uniref:formylglycine-generating enzyme family protein n=1 Tax=unclassified Brenneria TaxID=2634434 RepID=UPI0029C3A702|nr:MULTISPECIES: SUMF1/EgtB/PvdO family nonheme iron enzyme [unclassified Brenneria]MDX5627056.1 SUMF1/EgtB/PvdO family nonheme iron enzyme [Brenneria sp. L3-3Z]MDX5693594.1 SUMF1/EgtB/PvdO family nonheme iron enzyme [Brenneria sp. L4-2C]MEE3663535.1 SUMF1/EgtB/PvdO family nonheme iron enzyme [Brenneria sp. g21c3]